MSNLSTIPSSNFFSSLKVLQHAAATPLTTLLINLQLIAEDLGTVSTSSNTPHYLQKAIISTNYLKEIMSQCQEIPCAKANFFVKTALTEIIQICKRPSCKTQLISFIQVEPNLTLKGNKLYFQEAIICLLNNAFQAYKRPHPNQLVALFVSAENDQLIIKVVDGATGFLQLNDSSYSTLVLDDDKLPITGTGLTFAQKVISQHFNGKLNIFTKLHKGTTVQCELPLLSVK